MKVILMTFIMISIVAGRGGNTTLASNPSAIEAMFIDEETSQTTTTTTEEKQQLNSKMSDIEILLLKAMLAESVERFDDMASAMKELVKLLNGDLNTHAQKALLAVAYKNLVGAKRSSCRAISAIEERQQEGPNLELAKEYRKKVEKELGDVCRDLIKLLDDYIIPKKLDNVNQGYDEQETAVYFIKMKGDYYRYLTEVTAEQADTDNAHRAYSKAYDMSEKYLEATDPIRLGLALNYAVFHYEILSDPQEAIKVANKAYLDALHLLDNLNDDEYKDSAQIMSLIRDNLSFWNPYDHSG